MSKELEALEILKFLAYTKFEFDWDILEKPLKALEIIKEKRVNIQFFINCVLMLKDYEEYKHMYEFEIYKSVNTMSKILLSQEEYDLLKEVLL